tara:strand:+ start:879 stop:1214 length:336 start_codon:yes stop_codon:yes gene_type:complete
MNRLRRLGDILVDSSGLLFSGVEDIASRRVPREVIEKIKALGQREGMSGLEVGPARDGSYAYAFVYLEEQTNPIATLYPRRVEIHPRSIPEGKELKGSLIYGAIREIYGQL